MGNAWKELWVDGLSTILEMVLSDTDCIHWGALQRKWDDPWFPTNKSLHGRQHGRVVLVHIADVGLPVTQTVRRNLHRFWTERGQLDCDGHELLRVLEVV